MSLILLSSCTSFVISISCVKFEKLERYQHCDFCLWVPELFWWTYYKNLCLNMLLLFDLSVAGNELAMRQRSLFCPSAFCFWTAYNYCSPSTRILWIKTGWMSNSLPENAHRGLHLLSVGMPSARSSNACSHNCNTISSSAEMPLCVAC